MKKKCTTSSYLESDFLCPHMASNIKSNGVYHNDLDIPTSDRQKFRYLRAELYKLGQELKQNVRSGHKSTYRIQNEDGHFPHVELTHVASFLEHLWRFR